MIDPDCLVVANTTVVAVAAAATAVITNTGYAAAAAIGGNAVDVANDDRVGSSDDIIIKLLSLWLI